jgi:hypothetical protein
MLYLDQHVFEKAGASGCSNSAYRVVTLTCCDRQVVEDDELSDLYFDPTDLSRKVSLLGTRDAPPIACPLCRATDWEMLPVEEIADVSGRWRWACSGT